jgi:Secretion system C-terminal sorting domain
MRKNYLNPTKNIFAVKAIALLIIIVSAVFTPSANAQGLVFKEPKLISGSAGVNNAVYRFAKVATNVDALVKINGRSSAIVSLVSIDLEDLGHNKSFQPQVTYNNDRTPNGTSDWWMEFEITFVTAGTTTPVIVTKFDVTALDIDGNGDELNEWVSFYNLKTFLYEASTVLQSANIFETIASLNTLVGKKYSGPTTNFVDIDTSATKVMVTAGYENKNQFRIRTGGHAVGQNGAADRMYSFWFRTFTYQVPVQGTLPVTLSSFTARKAANNAVLDWATEMEKNVSHFVIQRSLDGTDYTDAGLIFTSGNSDRHKEYSFKDELKNINKGIVYYRLKMVDLDGRFEQSPVRVLRISEQNEMTNILAYPNPVVSELRITLPSNWQDNKVTIDVINTSGQILKHIVSSKASQTETVDMRDLGTGIYMVRATSGLGTAVQRVAKTK